MCEQSSLEGKRAVHDGEDLEKKATRPKILWLYKSVQLYNHLTQSVDPAPQFGEHAADDEGDKTRQSWRSM
jgi:hypothetical protein